MTSEIRANKQTNRAGLGTVTYTDTGIVVSGIVTANSFSGPISGTTGTFSGDIDVDGHTNLDNVSIAGVTTMTGALKISSTTDQMLELNSSDNNGTSLAFQRNNTRQGYIGYGGASSGLIIANEVNDGAVAIQGKDGGSVINMLSFASNNKGLATLHGGATIPLDLDVDGHTNLDNVSVSGATTCTGGAVFLNSISLNASSNNYLYFDDILHFTRNGHGTEMVIDASGRVGINEITPEAKLELDGRFRILDNSDGTPSSGKGLEISYYTSDDKADILSYDRGASAYKDLMIRGNSIDLRRNNTSLLLVGTGGGNGTVGFSTTAVLVTNGEKIAVRGYSSFKSYNSSYAAIYVSSEGNTNDTINNLINFNAGGANRGGIGYMPNTGELRFNNQYFMTFCTGAAILGGTERLRIHADGEVDIKGGAAGQNALLVTGNYSASNNVDIQTWQRQGGAVQAKLIYKDADTSIHFGTDTAHKLCFMTGGTERFRIDSTGRLIAGGASAGPYHQDGDEFNIYSTGNTGMSIFSGTSSLGSIFFADDNNDVHGQRRGAIQYNHNGNSLSFWTNASPRVTITSVGNVLCGGTAVSQTNRQLVVGSDAEANLAIETHNSASSETANIRFYRSRGTAASPTTLVDGDMISQLIFYPHDGTDYANQGAVIRTKCTGAVSSNNTPTEMTFHANEGSIATASERLRLSSHGHFIVTNPNHADTTTPATNNFKGLTQLGYQHWGHRQYYSHHFVLSENGTQDLFSNDVAYQDCIFWLNIVGHHANRTYATAHGAIGGYGIDYSAESATGEYFQFIANNIATGRNKLTLKSTSPYSATWWVWGWVSGAQNISYHTGRMARQNHG